MNPPSKDFFCNNPTPTNAPDFSDGSGWTMYFDEHHSTTGYEVSHSPAPDACSSVKKTEKSCRKLSLKKWKKKAFEEDDALEDTATSQYSSSKERGKGKQQKATQLRAQNREEEGLIERDSELKKNGLCLVPLSFAFDYFG